MIRSPDLCAFVRVCVAFVEGLDPYKLESVVFWCEFDVDHRLSMINECCLLLPWKAAFCLVDPCWSGVLDQRHQTQEEREEEITCVFLPNDDLVVRGACGDHLSKLWMGPGHATNDRRVCFPRSLVSVAPQGEEEGDRRRTGQPFQEVVRVQLWAEEEAEEEEEEGSDSSLRSQTLITWSAAQDARRLP